MFDQILLPTDGSDPAEEALDVAVHVADKYDANLHIMSIVEFIAYPKARELQLDRTKEIIEDARQVASAQGLTVQTEVVQDVEPHEAINTYGDAHEIDLVVMGTHGRSGLERFLLGSTTERTLRTSDIPVLTVPEKNI